LRQGGGDSPKGWDGHIRPGAIACHSFPDVLFVNRHGRSLDGVIAQSIKLQASLKLKLQHTGLIPAQPQEIGQ
ncbi:hypothetical protein, partial [Mesorhizobium sp. M7A.F.Ca.ET.027.03.2.1]|uniref:hypothetical protein n=1 Tax=Mesorhizobium sp. M7A.F.Ca.ET.027.03.2.1 TaxID=2496656 RepID=UPI001AEC8DFD